MKNLVIAVLTAVVGLVNIFAVDAWYQSVPYFYLSNIEIYLIMTTCIVIANLVASAIINKIHFKKKVETAPVNWISVDED